MAPQDEAFWDRKRAARLAISRCLRGDEPVEVTLGTVMEEGPDARRAFLYEILSQALAERSDAAAERTDALAAALGVPLDAVDRAVLDYACGRLGKALRRLGNLAPRVKQTRRAKLWHFYIVSNRRLRRRKVPVTEPPRILQFWDKDRPEDVAWHMDGWRHVAAAGYAAYDDDSARALVRDHLGEEGARAYDACWHPAMKADLFRLVALFYLGGLYVDADMRTTAATASTLTTIGAPLHLTVQTHLARGGIQNCVIGAQPGNRYIGACIEASVRNLLTGGVRNPLGVTGPGVLSHVLAETMGDPEAMEATALSLPETGVMLARNYAPSYKTTERSWQQAMRSQRAP